MGARTLPRNFGERRRIKGVLMCLGVFLEVKYREKERGKCPENAPTTQNLLSFCKMRGLVVFIGQN